MCVGISLGSVLSYYVACPWLLWPSPDLAPAAQLWPAADLQQPLLWETELVVLVIKIGIKGPEFAFVRAMTATSETPVPCEFIVI